jgi:TM2 domain-containing membrane protein YozV
VIGEKMSNTPGAYAPSGPPKSRVTAGILGILLGGLGVHKFYLGKAGLGIVYLLFCWSGVPAIIGFIEGIIYLTQDDATFAAKNGVNVA